VPTSTLSRGGLLVDVFCAPAFARGSTAGQPGVQDAMLLAINAAGDRPTMPELSAYARTIAVSPRRRRLTGSVGCPSGCGCLAWPVRRAPHGAPTAAYRRYPRPANPAEDGYARFR
jgi:hypothetical protein